MFNIIVVIILNIYFPSLALGKSLIVPRTEIERLLKIDTDRDKKITILDHQKSSPKFLLSAKDEKISVVGIYQLSNLLQELIRSDQGRPHIIIESDFLYENPVRRTSRLIRDFYWDGLTRKIDIKNLKKVLSDDKVKSLYPILYIPESDKETFSLFEKKISKNSQVQVKLLPKNLTPELVKEMTDNRVHGLLNLATRNDKSVEGLPYVVPGGRFNEMYGWDSYFIVLGLLADEKISLARNMVDHFVYEINHYGKVLNANRTYYLNRSQPPLLTSMIRAVYEHLPKDLNSKAWLKTSLLAAFNEYEQVWMGKERLTEIGLSRYTGFAPGVPPEVEAGHYEDVISPYAKKLNMTVESYLEKFNKGKISDSEVIEFFKHDRAVRESGHDTTYRWRVDGKDRCADFVTVDLNVLLYRYELDFAVLIQGELGNKFLNKDGQYFFKKMHHRKKIIRKYLFDEKSGLFFDYNWKNKKRSQYLSATTLFPLLSKEKEIAGSELVTNEEATKLLKNSLERLEAKGGVLSTDASSLEKFGNPLKPRQWEYPNGWAPHQMLIWKGLKGYQQLGILQRLVYKWLYMITKNAVDYNGTIPEKFDVVERSHLVFAEYGNVGTKFSYITKEGFGWMNASYQVGLSLLTPENLKMLEQLTPPEVIKF